nr:MAG TPA: hypothetical protein [Caudoviricetes sp.]
MRALIWSLSLLALMTWLNFCGFSIFCKSRKIKNF